MKEKAMESKTMAGFGIGLIGGAVIGGVMALLYAPKSGKEIRKEIKDITNEVVETVREETIGVIDAVKEETGEVLDAVMDSASKVTRKGEAAVKALKN